MFFEIFSNGVAPKKKFQKTLILAFEVIVQNTFFDIFKSTKNKFMEKKSQTKIMKITHIASWMALVSHKDKYSDFRPTKEEN